MSRHITSSTSSYAESLFILVASDGIDEKSYPPALRLSASKSPQNISVEPTKWAFSYNRTGWESSVAILLHLNGRFHGKEFTKTNITKQEKHEHLQYRAEVHRFEMKGPDIVNGPWKLLDPTARAQAWSVWSVDYLIFRRDVKATNVNTADCGRATAADDVRRLREFLTATTVYAKQRVSLLHKAAIDAPMHSEMIGLLGDFIDKCKEQIPIHLLHLRS